MSGMGCQNSIKMQPPRHKYSMETAINRVYFFRMIGMESASTVTILTL